MIVFRQISQAESRQIINTVSFSENFLQVPVVNNAFGQIDVSFPGLPEVFDDR